VADFILTAAMEECLKQNTQEVKEVKQSTTLTLNVLRQKFIGCNIDYLECDLHERKLANLIHRLDEIEDEAKGRKATTDFTATSRLKSCWRRKSAMIWRDLVA
jgi:hypothetical protein